MKRKIFAILAFLLCVTSVHAAVGQAVIDGMNYALSTDGEVRTATLLAGDKKYAGHVVIPSIVTFAGDQYKVTAVGNEAFKECDGLKSITFSDNVTTIGDAAFEGCTKITELVLPQGLTSIGAYAFCYCIKLASVTILSDAISITGAKVFQNCSALDSLVFGESVNTIRSSSFTLGNRTNVISLAMFPPVCEGDTSPFAGVSPYCVLYVPKGCAADYRMAKGWAGQFRAVDEMNDSSHSANYDVNGDGVVDIADATAVIECILAK